MGAHDEVFEEGAGVGGSRAESKIEEGAVRRGGRPYKGTSFRVDVRNIFFYYGFQFAAHDVGGKTGSQQTSINRGHFLFVDLFFCIGAAVGAEFAFDALADHCALVVGLCGFFQRGFDVFVWDAAGAEVAGYAEFSLFAGFGALAGELLGVASVVHQAIFFQARHDDLNEEFVVAAAFEFFLHFMDGVGAAH